MKSCKVDYARFIDGYSDFLKEFLHVLASSIAIIENVDSDSFVDFQFTAASEPIFFVRESRLVV